MTKLWNAARFAAGHLEDYLSGRHTPASPLRPVDPGQTVGDRGQGHGGMNDFEFSSCVGEAETFFWKALCDNYLEIVKARLYGPDPVSRRAAQHALYRALYGVLRLFAPVMVAHY